MFQRKELVRNGTLMANGEWFSQTPNMLCGLHWKKRRMGSKAVRDIYIK
jgi:hypothetical protein